MKLIALDVGTKRIGIAKADSAVRIAIPYSAVEVDGEEFKKIASLARAWDINNFVLGLPRNSQGEETEQSRYVRQFAKDLKRAIPSAKICFQDESLTSVEAEKRLKGRKKGYKKGDIDSEAAAIILQDFLEEKTGKSTTRAAATKQKSVKGVKSHRLLTAFVVLLCLFALLAGGGYIYYQYGLGAVSGVSFDCDSTEFIQAEPACDKVDFTIAAGDGVATIADNLKEAGLIRSSLMFQIYARLNSGERSLQAGEYSLDKAMTVPDIVEAMLHGGADNVFSFTIFPGDSIFDVEERLVSTGYDSTEIQAAFAKDYNNIADNWIFEGRPEGASLEGYLYGETYEFYKDSTVEEIIEKILAEFASVLKENDLKAKFEAHGYSLYQGITLASIVQREANNATDMAKVAQIFYNRLSQEIPLGSDVTVQYAVKLADPSGETYTNNAEALEIDSPYNTRKHAGLPQGPISNPGIDALLAVATPDGSMADMLFFLTGDDGVMYYSSTDEEHQQNIADHCSELCAAPLHN